MKRDMRSEYRRERAHRAPRGQAGRLHQAWASVSHGDSLDRRAEVLIAEDQDLRNYLRAPYDPLYGTQAARFFTRGVLHAATVAGLPRVGAIFIAVFAAIFGIIGAGLTLQTLVLREGLWGAAAIWSTLFTLLQGGLALALLRRLRGSGRRT